MNLITSIEQLGEVITSSYSLAEPQSGEMNHECELVITDCFSINFQVYIIGLSRKFCVY